MTRTTFLRTYTALPYVCDMHAVLTTDTFEADASEAGLSEDEIESMVRWLSANPLAGAVMQGTGGARTVHYYGGDDVPLFLLGLIDKGERDNLSKAERNALADELAHLADDYRAGVALRLARLKRRM